MTAGDRVEYVGPSRAWAGRHGVVVREADDELRALEDPPGTWLRVRWDGRQTKTTQTTLVRAANLRLLPAAEDRP